MAKIHLKNVTISELTLEIPDEVLSALSARVGDDVSVETSARNANSWSRQQFTEFLDQVVINPTTPETNETRDISFDEAMKFIKYDEFSDDTRRLIKVLYLSPKPVKTEQLCKKLKLKQTSIAALQGNMKRRVKLALNTDNPPNLFVQNKSTKELSIGPHFRDALDTIPARIATDW